ncbi:putative nucleoporin NUP53-like [Capsicum annuum]|nr:putative nucleoporin NUP53-like [Capsicum annuum]KAF3649685.1 putative nucleoporin NUP53-like [Capsicum annuum]
MEPKTLKQGQLNLAREVAVDIVQNTESGEASNLFLEGGKTVVQLKEALVLIEEAESALQEADPTGEVVKTNVVIQASCQCACPTAIIDDSPEQSKLKEPLSAPF